MLKSKLAGLIAASVLLSTAAMPGPAAASTYIEDFGARLKCKYYKVDGPPPYHLDFGVLYRVALTPPIMFGDFYGQTVAWRFLLKGQNYSYKSRLQSVITYYGVNAQFKPMHVNIDRPIGEDHAVLATIRMIWYASDGTRERVVDHEMQHQYAIVNNRPLWDVYDGECSGEVALEIIN